MTAGVRGLEDLCFNDLDLERIQIRANSENTRSRAVPERLGYTLEGIMRKAAEPRPDGTIGDSAMYSILRSEWAARG